MAFMVAYPNDELIRQFRCTHCDWTFHVQKPMTSDAPLELQKRYAERWYAGHRCSGSLKVDRQYVPSGAIELRTLVAEG